MLRQLEPLIGKRLHARDGEFGKVKDILFDSRLWTLRYLVVSTGTFLPGRKVLIPFTELDTSQWTEETIPVNLDTQQIKDSPPIEEDRPVSRQFEEELHSYFDWHPYWTPGALHPAPGTSLPGIADPKALINEEMQGDPNLRSLKEVMGYVVVADDGEAGVLRDLIVDDTDWMLRYAVIETRELEQERMVLVSLHWVDRVSWPDTSIHVDFDLSRIQSSPDWEPGQKIERDYEERLHAHYDRKPHWE